MANFNMGALSEWESIGAGEVLDFGVPPESGFRLVDFDVIANCMVSIHAVSGEAATLVAYSDGFFNVRFSSNDHTGVGFHFPEDGSVFIRTKFRSQAVAESDEPSFTNIEPRTPMVAPEVARMMQLSQLHARQREQYLLDQIATLHRKAADGQTDRSAPVPPAAPVPPLTGEPDASDGQVLES